jgi:uncharacterized protein (TIGR03066 family)
MRWLLFPALVALALTGCGSRGGQSLATTLIGTWDVTHPERNPQVYEFEKGGVLVLKTAVAPNANEWGRASQGRWEVLQSQGIDLGVSLRYDGREETLIINVKDNHNLFLSDSRGRNVTFRRRK